MCLVVVAVVACGGRGSRTSSAAQASSNTPAQNKAIARELIRNEYKRWDNATQLQCLHRTNPWPQIAWGLRYIDKRYGTPCKAWQRFKRGGGY